MALSAKNVFKVAAIALAAVAIAKRVPVVSNYV